MAQSLSTAALAERAHQAAAAVPWYIWCVVFAATSTELGIHWDISWHRSIGRDTFWTPAHIAIYLGAVAAGFPCAYLILRTTFSKTSPLAAAAVSMWGFRGPIGAFIAAWGGVAMLTSAPYDDWWHNAYGLDVKILSPPHAVLAMGIFGMQFGALILILGEMNRARRAYRAKLNRLFLYVGGMLVVILTALTLEYSAKPLLHTARFYRVMCIAIPAVLAGLSRASGSRWAATTVAGVYSVFLLALLWLLPLFPAEPKLGPVYQQVTHFIPAGFPILLIAPALLLDLLWSKTRHWNQWLLAAVSAAVFLGALLAAEWPFAGFLMTPAARNRFWGSHYMDYLTRPTGYTARYLFAPSEKPPLFLRELATALAAAFFMTRIGLAWGNWMQRVRR